jgi:hypothetical protein
MARTPSVIMKVPRNAKIGCLKNIDLVVEHDAISRNRGSVLFGRVGRGLAKEKISLLRDAIDSHQKPSMYLIRKSEFEYEFFRSEIIGIWGPGYKPDMSCCPAYYSDLYNDITLWIEIRAFEKIQKDGMLAIRLMSTGRPILDLLASQASLMLAESVS